MAPSIAAPRTSSWELGLTMRASWLATAVSGAAGVVIRALGAGQAQCAVYRTPASQNGQHGRRPSPLSAHQ